MSGADRVACALERIADTLEGKNFPNLDLSLVERLASIADPVGDGEGGEYPTEQYVSFPDPFVEYALAVVADGGSSEGFSLWLVGPGEQIRRLGWT